jgi:hypothetical protein
VVRCATLAPGDQVDELLARLGDLERRLAGGGGGGGPGGGGDPPARSKPGARSSRAEPEPTRQAAPAPAAPVAAAPEESGAAELGEPAGDAPLPVVFDRLRGFAQQANRGLFAALEGGRLVARTDETIRIALPSAIAVRRLEARLAELEAVALRFFGGPRRVVLESDGPAAEATPRAAGPDPLAQRRRQEALNHPAVNQALEILQGEIVEIKPLGGN